MTINTDTAALYPVRTELRARFFAWIARSQKTRLQRELRNHGALNGLAAGLSPDLVSFDFGHYDPVDHDRSRRF